MREIELVNQILQEVLRVYGNKEYWLEFNDLLKTKQECLDSGEQDFEIEDMEKFLNKYKFMNIFSYGFNYEIQKLYNTEYLMAGWSYCGTPEELLNFFKDYSLKKSTQHDQGKVWFNRCQICGKVFPTKNNNIYLCDDCTKGERK